MPERSSGFSPIAPPSAPAPARSGAFASAAAPPPPALSLSIARCSEANACVTPPELYSMTIGLPVWICARMRLYAIVPPCATTEPIGNAASSGNVSPPLGERRKT